MFRPFLALRQRFNDFSQRLELKAVDVREKKTCTAKTFAKVVKVVSSSRIFKGIKEVRRPDCKFLF